MTRGTCRRRPRRALLRAAAALLLGVATLAAQAGETLDGVKARGVVRCGVSEGIAGFSEKDASGRWRGFDVDFCRGVAAAVFGSPDKVAFVPLKASTRFPALQACRSPRRSSRSARSTCWRRACCCAVRIDDRKGAHGRAVRGRRLR